MNPWAAVNYRDSLLFIEERQRLCSGVPWPRGCRQGLQGEILEDEEPGELPQELGQCMKALCPLLQALTPSQSVRLVELVPLRGVSGGINWRKYCRVSISLVLCRILKRFINLQFHFLLN